jgi:hypothetical protein
MFCALGTTLNGVGCTSRIQAGWFGLSVNSWGLGAVLFESDAIADLSNSASNPQGEADGEG